MKKLLVAIILALAVSSAQAQYFGYGNQASNWTVTGPLIGQGTNTFSGTTAITGTTTIGAGSTIAAPTVTGTLAGAAATLSTTLGVTGVATFTVSPVITTSATPAAAAACTAGTISWGADYLYVCTASGVWKRAALTGGY